MSKMIFHYSIVFIVSIVSFLSAEMCIGQIIDYPLSIWTGSQFTIVPIVNPSQDLVTQFEPSIYIDPTNSSRVLIHTITTGWNPDALPDLNPPHNLEAIDPRSTGWYLTTDGGVTWNPRQHSIDSKNFGDPTTSIAMDGFHSLYINFLNSSGGQTLKRSTNNGLTWSEHIVSSSAKTDKNHMAVDNNTSSPYFGHIYVAYLEETLPQPPSARDIYVRKSTDGGTSWLPPSGQINISKGVGDNFSNGINLSIGKSGIVYAVWAAFNHGNANAASIYFSKSTDGGMTWLNTPRKIADIAGLEKLLTKKSNDTLNRHVRVNSFPVIAVNPNDEDEKLYVVWAQKEPNLPAGYNYSDVAFSRSLDGGSTWSTPIIVNDDNYPFCDQWMPWITVDPVSNAIGIIFYDSRESGYNHPVPQNTMAKAYLAFSEDNGLTFKNVAVDEHNFVPRSNVGASHAGDYIGIASAGGRFYMCWTKYTGETRRNLVYFTSKSISDIITGPNYDVSVKNLFENPIPGPPHEGGDFIYDEICDAAHIKNSGTVLSLPIGFHHFRSEFPYYPNPPFPNAYTNTFNNWNQSRTDYFFKKTQYISSSVNLESYLDLTASATLECSFIEDLSIKGILHFRDPWDIRRITDCLYSQAFPPQFRERNIILNEGQLTPYQSGDKGGVFLNRSFDVLNLAIPYYSIRASKFLSYFNSKWNHKESLPLAPGDGIFREWNAWWNKAILANDPKENSYPNSLQYSTRAVTFKEDNAEVEAVYKSHLMSDLLPDLHEPISAISPNSQRKMSLVFEQHGVQYPQGLYQCVYESGGRVWFTQSSDHGITWSPEELICSSSGGSHPCITATINGAFVAYTDVDGLGNWFVHLKYLDANSDWIEIPISLNAAIANCAPVLECKDETLFGGEPDNVVLLVWEGITNYLQYAAFLINSEKLRGTIPGSGGNASPTSKSVYPTLARFSTQYYLAWREAEKMYFKQIDLVRIGQSNLSISFYTREEISTWWQLARQAPSITVDAAPHPSVAWGSEDNLHGKYISFRQKLTAGWGTQATIITGQQGDEYWAPSIIGLNNVMPHNSLRIVHNHTRPNGIQRLKVQRLGIDPNDPQQQLVSWTESTFPDEALHPSAVGVAPDGYSKFVYPGTSSIGIFSALRELKFSSELVNLPKRHTTFESAREVNLWQDSSRATLRLGEVDLKVGTNETKIDWNTGFDTLVVGKTKSVRDYLRTEAFDVPQNSHLRFRIAKVKDGSYSFADTLRLRIQLVNGNTQQVLAELGSAHPRSLARGRYDNRFNQSLNNFAGQRVYLRIELEGMDSTINIDAIDYYVSAGGVFPKIDGSPDEEISTLPAEYTLDQNHPNPFGRATFGNATTEISYSIPEEGTVQLLVLDLLGREVATLVNEYKPIGTHTVTFNGEHLPSGVYYYRLVANGQALTRKMTLMK